MPVQFDAIEVTSERLSFASAQVLAVRGKERVSRPYRWQVSLLVPRAELEELASRALGERVGLALRLGAGGDRTVTGVVERVEIDPRTTHDRDVLALSIVPELALLRRRQQSRLFQDKTAIEIVEQLLGERGVAVRRSLARSYPTRDLCTQYLESDLDFVQRILAEEGVFYVFDHTDDGKERVVMCDEAEHAPRPDELGGLTYRPVSGLAEARASDVNSFRRARSVMTSRVELREFDFERPSFRLSASARLEAEPSHDLELYDHHGQHGGLDVHPVAARRRLEQTRRLAERADGTSRCAALAAGHSFHLSGAPLPGDDGDYTVLGVDHDARLPEAGGAELVYQNRFTCVPRSVAPRPRAPRRKLCESLLTATVVGPAQQEIHTDVHGRIKVQFHWDREGQRDERSSAWIRVAQTWAGVGWGHQFIPRVGMEVLIAFVGGDPDRPLAVSAVPNAEHPPPFPLPQSKSKSGLRTQTTRGGGGFHELSFEDRAGYERVFLRSQRDLEEEILNDRFTTVGHDRVTRVGATCTSEIGADQICVVSHDRIAAVSGDDVTTVGGGSRLEVDGDLRRQVGGAEHSLVTGDHHLSIGGASEDRVGGRRRSRVGADLALNVGGSRTSVVRGSDTTSVGGDVMISSDAGLYANAKKGLQAVVGDADERTLLEVSGDGEARLALSQRLVVEAERAIVLRVGKTELTIDEQGIRLTAGKLESNSDETTLVARGASLRLDEDVLAAAREVRLTSAAKASLSLASSAELDGNPVHLGKAAGTERKLAEERKKQAPQLEKRKIWLFDLSGARCEGGPYELSMPGWTQRGTAQGGCVEVPKFPGEERCSLRWGRALEQREPHERDPELEFESVVCLHTEVDDAEERARRKLSNLGHTHVQLEHALSAFGSHKGEQPADRAAALAAVDRQHSTLLPAKARL